jgi:DNA-3-methyladenine glycosylase
MSTEKPLPLEFYSRDALHVAYDLIGCEIQYGEVRLKIVEVEAYRFPGDTASHARSGRTERNAPMWGPPGRSYIYLCYGLHSLLNLVSNQDGEPAAVLIRAAEPLAGLEQIQKRRGGMEGPALLNGPGKVSQALGVSCKQSGCALDGELSVFPRAREPDLLAGPRIGIEFASPEDRSAPWRIALAGSRWVGHRGALKPV